MPPITSSQMPQERHNKDRMRRADSWLEHSERAGREREKAGAMADTGLACEQFMFLWIAFNAAYGYQSIDERADKRHPEKKQFKRFLHQVVNRDEGRIIANILWLKCAGPVRRLLDNKYTFGKFWDWVRGSKYSQKWYRQFEEDITNAEMSKKRK